VVSRASWAAKTSFFFFETRLQRLARVTWRRGFRFSSCYLFIYLEEEEATTTTRFSKIEISIL
jgi:hypothetical protein